MKIPANANTKYLRNIIADLRESIMHYETDVANLSTKLAAATAESIAAANAKVDRMGDKKPWKLIALAFVAGVVIGWIAG